MLDVNAGIPLADEPRILAEAIQLVQSITDVPLSIDSSIVEALEAGTRGVPRQGVGELGDRGRRSARTRIAAGRQIRRGRGRHLQRRNRHFRRSE